MCVLNNEEILIKTAMENRYVVNAKKSVELLLNENHGIGGCFQIRAGFTCCS